MTAIDVFVVSHHHERTLAATMAGLAAQTLRPDRVVIVDNASADGSIAAARAGAGALPLDVIANAENRGFAAAANQALRATAGEWVLALNPDCRLDPEFLARLVAAAAERPRVGAATGLLLRAAGQQLDAGAAVDSAGIVVTATGRHLDRGAGRPAGPAVMSPAWVFGATGAAALYRRAALDDIAYAGGEVFDEGFFSYREDADLAWRLQRRGWRCLYWPEARAAHGRGLKPEARRLGTPDVNRHSVRNRFLLRMANADWRWHLACFPFWLLRDLAVVGACLTVERSSLPGLAEAWRLRRRQRSRGHANAERAVVSGWAMARWFVPGRRVERIA